MMCPKCQGSGIVEEDCIACDGASGGCERCKWTGVKEIGCDACGGCGFLFDDDDEEINNDIEN